jgi:pyruvate,water dikinase
MAWSRAAGVLQTTNVAEGRPHELVINVGLGLGEGIVSGIVAADNVVVSKEHSPAAGQLRFRYVTAEKRERVVFDARAGCGTRRVGTLSHQRLRPVLEYVELAELVQLALELEAALHQALDIEFAWEGPSLRILQVRRIPAWRAVWRETALRFPLGAGRGGQR